MILARAPLRLPLGGGGTDLPSYYSRYGGFLLSAAINKYVYIYVNRPAADRLLRIKYSKYEQVDSVDRIQHDLVRPALQLLELDGCLEIVSMADVPDGTGLGSSGSYLVALLTALHELKRERIPTQALAEEACHIEMDLAGHPSGKQDQYLATFGGFTCLDIQMDGKVRVMPLDISQTTVHEMRHSLLLFYTGITRSSREILGVQRQETERGTARVLDSLHHVKDLAYRIKAALEKGDLDAFGHLLDEHWQSKKQRSDNISAPEIDRWYTIAKANGALGGKIVGAGGGGFLMLYCPSGTKRRVLSALNLERLHEMSVDFDYEGAKVLVNF
jgi:D-glycero-alpha-D-manno-heptose-7-phosphate kinase